MVQHHWNDMYCSCGQDVVTCQVCGGQMCGNVTVRINGKNACPRHVGVKAEALRAFGLEGVSS